MFYHWLWHKETVGRCSYEVIPKTDLSQELSTTPDRLIHPIQTTLPWKDRNAQSLSHWGKYYLLETT